MNALALWSLVLVIVGLLAMLVGAVDPLEGLFVILPGSAVVALSAILGLIESFKRPTLRMQEGQ